MRELELKCVVAEDFELRHERLVVPGACLAGRQTRRIHDVYFDTGDLRLARWGVTLRWRDGEGWTVKVPRPSTDVGVLDRDEVHLDGERAAIPAEAVALVAPFARDEALVEVARIDTDRTARVWQRRDGTVVGELVDDHVIGTTQAGTVRFREIEFELDADADPESFRSVIKQLGVAGGRLAVPKLVRVLSDPAAGPADVVCPALPEDPSAAAVIHAAIAASVHQLLTYIPAARLGTDPEGVHQARVATRRLRSDLRTFAPLLDRGWAKQLRHELRWLADELGTVRDADVLDIHIAAALDVDADGGAEIRSHLARQRALDRKVLLGHLADSRAVELFDHLVDAASSPRLRGRAHRHRAVTALPPLVRAGWGALRAGVEDLGSSPVDVELHEIRILAKRARYGAEAVSPAVGKEARKFAKAAASIQDSLGDLHDSAVAADWLEHAAATTALSAGGAFAAGRFAQQLRAQAAVDRTDWQPSYEKMRRRSRWLEHHT